jgi:hypothetical protein
MDKSFVDRASILEIIEHVELLIKKEALHEEEGQYCRWINALKDTLVPPSTRRARVKRDAGLCTQCSSKAALGTLCEACNERSAARARGKRGNREWAPGSRGRPPLKRKLIPK